MIVGHLVRCATARKVVHVALRVSRLLMAPEVAYSFYRVFKAAKNN